MRFPILVALTVLSAIAFVPNADAAIVCTHGVREAVCTGPSGAAAVRRPLRVCHWVAGRRVCR
jgi:hypothetical protein